MGLLDDIVAGAIGYGIASAKDSKVVGDIIDNNIKRMTLEEIIDNYTIVVYYISEVKKDEE